MKSSGFTLVEILLVLCIAATMTSILLGAAEHRSTQDELSCIPGGVVATADYIWQSSRSGVFELITDGQPRRYYTPPPGAICSVTKVPIQ